MPSVVQNAILTAIFITDYLSHNLAYNVFCGVRKLTSFLLHVGGDILRVPDRVRNLLITGPLGLT
jgi:hypothetical protein